MVLKYALEINSETGECLVSDKPHLQITKQFDVTQSEIDFRWYLTSKLLNDRAYQLKVFNKRKQEKYQAIIDRYDEACKYGLTDVKFDDKTYMANRSWLGTWAEVLDGLSAQESFTKEPIKTFVRLYEKIADKYKNVTIENITLAQYRALYLELINFRFNVLQATRNSRFQALEQAQTIEEIELIPEDFGVCIDEQNDYKHLIIN